MGLCGLGVGLVGGFFFPLLVVVAVAGFGAYMVLRKDKETKN